MQAKLYFSKTQRGWFLLVVCQFGQTKKSGVSLAGSCHNVHAYSVESNVRCSFCLSNVFLHLHAPLDEGIKAWSPTGSGFKFRLRLTGDY